MQCQSVFHGTSYNHEHVLHHKTGPGCDVEKEGELSKDAYNPVVSKSKEKSTKVDSVLADNHTHKTWIDYMRKFFGKNAYFL